MQNKIRGSIFNRTVGSKGRHNATIKAKEFWKYYYGGNVSKPIPFSKAKEIFSDMCIGMSNLLLTEEFIYMNNVGFFGVSMKKTSPKNAKKRINWPETEKMWLEKYPNISLDELKRIENKPLVLFRNKLPLNTSLRVQWVKKGEKFTGYAFEPITRVRRGLGNVVHSTDNTYLTSENFKSFIHALRKGVKL
jgi:hypothetical protein